MRTERGKSPSLVRRSESLRVCVGHEPEGGERSRELIPLNVSRVTRIVDGDGDKTREASLILVSR